MANAVKHDKRVLRNKHVGRDRPVKQDERGARGKSSRQL